MLTAGLDPCEALVSFAAIGAVPAANFAGRQWPADDWKQATRRPGLG